MLVVDANVWVACIHPSEPGHGEAVAFLMSAAAEVFVCPALVLPEVSGAAARRSRDHREGTALANQVLADKRIRFEPLDFGLMHAAGELAAHLFLRGADAVYVAVAKLNDAALVTPDRELRLRSGAEITALSPAEWLAAQTPAAP